MSTPDQGAVRNAGRPVAFAPWLGGLALGILLAVVATALFYLAHDPNLVPSRLSVTPNEVEHLALGLAALAIVLVAVNIDAALDARKAYPLTAIDEGAGPVTPGAELGSYRGDVLLKLSEPKPRGAELILLDAVRLAISECQGSTAAAFAGAFAERPEEVVTMYATFFAEHVPIYGCKRPSSTIEQVFLMAPLKEFSVEDGVLVLQEREGFAIYDGLCIKADDYGVVLAQLRSGT